MGFTSYSFAGEVIAAKPSGAGKSSLDLGSLYVGAGLLTSAGSCGSWVATSSGMLTGCSVSSSNPAAVSAQLAVNGNPTGIVATNVLAPGSTGAVSLGSTTYPFTKGDMVSAQITAAISALNQTFTVHGEAILSS